MFIKKINTENNIKAIAIILLTSIDINERSIKTRYIKQNTRNICKNAIECKNDAWYNNLWVVWRILSLNIKQKQKIALMLKDCSRNYHENKKNKFSSGYKYLQRFRYKYHKYYNKSFKLNECNRNKNTWRYYSIEVAILYLAYKILQANSKFSACRKFK